MKNKININGRKYFLLNTNGVTTGLNKNDTITYCVYYANKINAVIPYFKVTSFVEVAENTVTGNEVIMNTYGSKKEINKLKKEYFL